MTHIQDFLRQAGFIKNKPGYFYTIWASLGATGTPPLNRKDAIDLIGRAAWLFKVKRADRTFDQLRNTVLGHYSAWRAETLPMLPQLDARQKATLITHMADLGLKDPDFLQTWKQGAQTFLPQVSNRDLSRIVRAIGILKESLLDDFGRALALEIEKRCNAPNAKDRPDLQECAAIASGLAMMDAALASPLYKPLCEKVLNSVTHAAPKRITESNISSLRPIRDAAAWFDIPDLPFPKPTDTSGNTSSYESDTAAFLRDNGLHTTNKGKAVSEFGKVADLEMPMYGQTINIEADGPSHRIRTYPDLGSEYSGATLLQTALDVKIAKRPIVRIYSETYNSIDRKNLSLETMFDMHELFSGVADASADGKAAGYELVLKPASRGGGFEMKKMTR
ncbi:MAG: hypothetical protein EBQ96_06790 [Proteobacteria bacterium]|nr:hypothetical protein [Pseudomonadota bacterium]